MISSIIEKIEKGEKINLYNVNNISDIEDKLVRFLLCENNGELSLKKLEFGVNDDNVDEMVITTPFGLYYITFQHLRNVIQGGLLEK